ncbi:MAG: hypothetical protein O3A00_07640 [Planctomycetota bacterium]|nr:hypothetical protein [Planctomycetota bacterium]
MAHVDAVLEAGGLVPAKSKIADPQAVDAISARRYQHSALGDRPVVRLTPDALSQGDDLALEFLGFASPDVVGPVAMCRRQALGFPGWALINDPKHARYALEIVKEFRKEVRRAKSKPGHAYDGFVAIAEKLGRGVAHFLPSFWEEVGRELMAVGNQSYAGRAFNKAREAEKVHALKVDEVARQQSFLEFALAGCLSNKSLTEHAKELQESHDANDAWTYFRELAVRRTKGGMPPWISMPKELAQLASGAGLDADAELTRVLEEIVEMPSMTRASIAFWNGCSKAVRTLAAGSDRVAGVLLNMLPQVSRWDCSPIWDWLGLLETWGLLPNLWRDDVSDAASPKDGSATWLSKIATVNSKPPQLVLDLLPRMAERLIRDKQPVRFAEVNRWGASYCVDLLDLALELKIPVADPPEDASFDLGFWSKTKPSEGRPRDPIHIQADQRFAKLLDESVAKSAGGTDFEAAAQGKTAMKDARRNWLLGLLDAAAVGALPQAIRSLDKLNEATSRAQFQEFPDAYKKLQELDLTPVLQRTLQGGLIDEYGWPALEAAVARLKTDESTQLQFFGMAPHVVVTDGLQALVVGPQAVVFEHELRLPKDFQLERLEYLDGQLHVRVNKRHERKKYWSDDPKKVVDSAYIYGSPVSGAAVPVESGGSFVGEAIVHAGDAEIPRSTRFFSDGQHFWRVDFSGDEAAIREVDPTTGKVGRHSLPTFFENFLKDGWRIDERSSELLKLGPGIESSPLGCVDGQTGWRVRRDVEADSSRIRNAVIPQRVECERIDGKTWNVLIDGLRAPVGLLDQPGSDQCLAIDGEYGWAWSFGRIHENCSVWSPDGRHQLAELRFEIGPYSAGQAVGLPPLFWHAFVARDVKTSKKLRAITQNQAATLLNAAAIDVGDLADDSTPPDDIPAALPKTSAAVGKWLSTLKDARFARGVAGLVYFAGRQAARLQQLIESRNPAAEDSIVDVMDAAIIKPAMAQLGIRAGYRDLERLLPHISEVVEFFRGEREKDGAVTTAPFDWTNLLDGLEGLAWQAYWLDSEGDTAYLDFLDVWVKLGVADLPGSFRKFEGKFTSALPFATPTNLKPSEVPWFTYSPKPGKESWTATHPHTKRSHSPTLSLWRAAA